jgi:hypothetical protein
MQSSSSAQSVYTHVKKWTRLTFSVVVLSFSTVLAHAAIQYGIHQSGSGRTVNPLSANLSAEQFYQYDDVSTRGNPTGFTLTNGTGYLWLYRNNLDNALSLGFIFGPPNAATAQVRLGFNGLPNSGFISVWDDRETDQLFNSSTGLLDGIATWNYAANKTDGGMISGLEGKLFETTLNILSQTNVPNWVFLSNDGSGISETSFDPSKSLLISARDVVTPPPPHPVPEPFTLLALGGLMGLVGLRRKLS